MNRALTTGTRVAILPLIKHSASFNGFWPAPPISQPSLHRGQSTVPAGRRPHGGHREGETVGAAIKINYTKPSTRALELEESFAPPQLAGQKGPSRRPRTREDAKTVLAAVKILLHYSDRVNRRVCEWDGAKWMKPLRWTDATGRVLTQHLPG
uniref:Uncharacterized protein n=1 Tax=Anopheles maculatus TaxID=74869 RepID=A0A182SQH6_9DIPT